jgi:prephenate dehydrogenase
MHLALIGYGEVGRILGEDLRAAGHGVTAFDVKLGRKAASRCAPTPGRTA